MIGFDEGVVWGNYPNGVFLEGVSVRNNAIVGLHVEYDRNSKSHWVNVDADSTIPVDTTSLTLVPKTYHGTTGVEIRTKVYGTYSWGTTESGKSIIYCLGFVNEVLTYTPETTIFSSYSS